MTNFTFQINDEISAAIDVAVLKRGAAATRPRPSRSSFARDALIALLHVETGFTADAGATLNKAS